jgi:choline dehydrogenase
MIWDYIVIGAGSAGCALAYELAKSGKESRVLILEAGGADRSPLIKVPAGQIRAVARYDWGYHSLPDSSRNGAAEGWLRGRVVGGSSSINGTVFVRGAAQDFDRWEARLSDGNGQGWSADDILPIFRELETSDRIGPLRGQSGPLHVRTVLRPHKLTHAFVSSATASGHRFNEDYNGTNQEGVGYAQLSQRKGLRCSAADAFLKPIMGAKNIKLVLKATVEKIELDSGRATGVMFSSSGKKCREVGRDIILCAGAIASPILMMLSGIGDPEELERHKIRVAIDLPGVGRNLKEHPLLRLTYRTVIPSYNLTEGLVQKLRIGIRFLIDREGPISNLFEGVAFVKSRLSEANPDIQLHFTPVGYLTRPDGMIELAPFPSVTVVLNKSHPESSGRIRLKSANPSDNPLIECSLLGEEADVETLVRGIVTVRRIMSAEPIAGLVQEEIAPGKDVESIAELTNYVRGHTGIAFHPVGTCRMGVDGKAVVSPDCLVRGTANLWVADASIMPDLISGNTNAACMMIGAKLGKQLSERRP